MYKHSIEILVVSKSLVIGCLL